MICGLVGSDSGMQTQLDTSTLRACVHPQTTMIEGTGPCHRMFYWPEAVASALAVAEAPALGRPLGKAEAGSSTVSICMHGVQKWSKRTRWMRTSHSALSAHGGSARCCLR